MLDKVQSLRYLFEVMRRFHPELEHARGMMSEVSSYKAAVS
jgi:hypothetical protein